MTVPVKAKYVVVRKSSACPRGKFCEEIRCRGRHHQSLMVSSNINVLDCARKSFSRIFAREQICDDLLPGQGSEGKRLDELASGPGHDDLNLVAVRLESAHQFRRFVGCDTAANSQKDTHSRQAIPLPGPGLLLASVGVGNESATSLFHRQAGGFLIGGRQNAALAVLQLAGTFRRYNDEAVGAGVLIVRDAVHRVVRLSAIVLSLSTPIKIAKALSGPKLLRIGRIWSSIRIRRTRSAFTIAASVPVDWSRR